MKSILRLLRQLSLRAMGIKGLQDQQSAMLKEITGIKHRLNPDSDIEWLRNLYPGVSLDALKAKLSEQAAADHAGRLLNLHYPPSYDLKPRWGYSCPVHQGICRIFEKNVEEYNNVLRDLAALLPYFLKIRKVFANDGTGEPGWAGGAINAIDTGLLYGFVKKHQPKIYLEIGSGLTTLFAARAKSDHQLETQIVSIDPNPRAEVDARCDRVIRAPLERCDLSIFDRLEPGDIVFMDGSHISLMNSDVTVFMLDVVPRLKPGVLVHIHDIHLPHDYPDMFVKWYWNEQYIVAAYLLGAADRIKVLMPSRYAGELSTTPEILRSLIASGLTPSAPHWLSGGSLWFTHTR
jgi:hypothetical protein